MFRDASLLRALFVGAICVPLALFLGYLLATPDRTFSIFWIALALGLITLPLLLKWHHALLIVLWNVQILAFMLPGKPRMIFVIGAVSIVISLVARALKREGTYIHQPWIAFPLLALVAITLFTMDQRGGVGGRVFGSETWGASRYLGVFGAIVAYFAMVAEPVAPSKRKLMAALFFLSGTSVFLVDLFYVAGPSFYFLLSFFPDTYSSYHGLYLSGMSVQRFAGFGQGAIFFAYFMMVRFGIKGIFEWRKPWRWGTFITIFLLALLGGFRGAVVSFAILFTVQFYFERLYRTNLVMVFTMVGMICGAMLFAFADSLPMSMQRSLSFLPIEVDPLARKDAADTLAWRVEMWKTVAPEVPKYLWLGKGFAFEGTDVQLSQYGWQRGFYTAYERALITGNYHHGILTLMIPLGLFGFLAFVAFCWASLRALLANYRYGDADLKTINTFLLCYFLTKLLWYLVFYGEFFLDLMMFTGIIGLSLTINGGVAKKPATEPVSQEAEPQGVTALQTALRLR